MADRLEVQFVSIRQGGGDTTVTVRLYRLGDAVVDGEGHTTYPRTLLRTVTETIGDVHPWGRFMELYQAKADQLRTQFGWVLPEIVCSL